MKRSLLSLALAASLVPACASRSDAGAAAYPASPPPTTTESVALLPPAGPQSFTPEAKPKGRSRALTLRWSSRIGRTDHRTTMAFANGAIYVGAGKGVDGAAGVYVVDGKTGAQRATLPAARGDVVGIALAGDRVYSSSSAGEAAATTREGRVVFRVDVGAPITTPPTLVAIDDKGTLAVAVGDARGRVHLLDGSTGATRWTHALSGTSEARPAIGSGLAAADLDGDGSPEILAGTEGGRLSALRSTTGETAWALGRSSALRAAPLVADVDADGRYEVIVGWADGDVAIVDGPTGKETWSAHVEEDDGDPTGVLSSPTPLPGPKVGSLIVPTARWGKEDAVVVLRAHYRAYQSRQGRVVASPILGVLEPGSDTVDAVVGTEGGDVVALDASGGVGYLYHFDGPIAAPAMLADLDGDGMQELVVVTAAGRISALATHATSKPALSRARGDSMRNDGVLPAIDLGWKLP